MKKGFRVMFVLAAIWIHGIATANASQYACSLINGRTARLHMRVLKDRGLVEIVHAKGSGFYAIPADLSPVRVFPSWHHNVGAPRIQRGIPGLSIQSSLLRASSGQIDVGLLHGELTLLNEIGDTIYYDCAVQRPTATRSPIRERRR